MLELVVASEDLNSLECVSERSRGIFKSARMKESVHAEYSNLFENVREIVREIQIR